MKAIIIHYRESRAKHIRPRAFRSSIRLLVTCKVCQRKHWPAVVQRKTL